MDSMAACQRNTVSKLLKVTILSKDVVETFFPSAIII